MCETGENAEDLFRMLCGSAAAGNPAGDPPGERICEELPALLCDLLGGALPESGARRFLRHGAQCPSCRDVFETEFALRRIMRRSCAAPAPERLRAVIYETLTEEIRTEL